MLKIGVVGGGVAGIAAALEAGKTGVEVTLFEALRHLGGRAAGGKRWDTGRHFLTTAYRDFFRLVADIGSRDSLALKPLALGTELAVRRPFWFLKNPLFGSAVASMGLFSSGFLPFPAGLAALPAMKRSLRDTPSEPDDDALLGDPSKPLLRVAGRTIADHFHEAGWPEVLIERLGAPLARGMCNLEPELAASEPFLRAFKRVFADPERLAGWVQGAPGKLISKPAHAALEKNGVTVRLNTPVTEVVRKKDKWEIITRDGELTVDRLIVTVPPWSLSFLGECEELEPLLKESGNIDARTIMTVSAVFDGIGSLPGPLAGRDEGNPIWFAEPEPHGGVLVEQVFSGLTQGEKTDPEKLKNVFLERAKVLLNAYVLRGEVRVRKYRSATPSLFPGTPRPVLRQAKDFFYAGDWSATGLPPSLESAAKAGALAGKTAAL